MKTLVFIFGATSFSLTTIGVLCKIQYWPGGSAAIVLGLGTFTLLFIPLLAKFLHDRVK